nr:hypothetical protein CFP56_50367 [Quercus suber]
MSTTTSRAPISAAPPSALLSFQRHSGSYPASGPIPSILHEFASISAQRASAFFLFSRAISRFLAVRSNRSARRHLFTWVLMSLHMPMDFQRNPRAWHSSRAVMTSSQPV